MTDSAERKVTADHLRRSAYLYVRQSTVRQVKENTESTARQYALKRRAVGLGWPEEQVVVIDCDLGLSGASAGEREGFQRLVSEVGMGRVGLVMGLEVSRLARNCSDWHRLLQICAFSRSLILDEDGLYDPTEFNDRLLLGLKGTMSEAELHVLSARLRGGMLNKARRGELALRLPVGFRYDTDGRVVLDPDRQVQESLRLFFTTFRRVGSAHRTVRLFADQGLEFPRRVHSGPDKGELLWSRLTDTRAVEVLHNPRYAGAYVYGRRRERRAGIDGPVVTENLPREKWHTLLPDAHEGYISWQEFEQNQQLLRDNTRVDPQSRRCPPREGPALLQGLAVCGRCGAGMTVRYHARRGVLSPEYTCVGAGNTQAQPRCQSVPGASIDAAIGELLLEVVTPMALEVTLAVQHELQTRIEQADELRGKQVERARYEADLARRRYMQVDPANRLVADSLEAEWNQKLRALEVAREEYERRRQEDRLVLDETKRAQVLALASDFPRLWRDPGTPDRERKRVTRLLIEDVTLIKSEELTVQVRFRGGVSRTLTLRRPSLVWEDRRVSPEVVAEIDRLLGDHTHREIATWLNGHGFVSGTGKSFDGQRVGKIQRAYRLAPRYRRLRAAGLLNLKEVAMKLGVSTSTLKVRRRAGRLDVCAHRLDDVGRYLYDDPGKRPEEATLSTRSEEA